MQKFIENVNHAHLSSMVLRNVDFLDLISVLAYGNTFQNLRVSSPAPVTMVWPDGFIAKNNTRLVCPVKVVTFSKLGYFQTIISLFEYPCVETNSFVVLENIRLQTWEPVSILSSIVPSRVFQNFMVLSADPPPEAKTPCVWGLQARALTAAECWLNLLIGTFDRLDQIINLLSFPPDASWFPSKDHFSPHTSWVCPSYLWTIERWFCLRSLKLIVLSRDPLASMFVLQARELTLSSWPATSYNLTHFEVSQIYVVPWLVPIAMWVPGSFHPILEIEWGFKSKNLRTLLLLAFQKYKLESKATERMFWDDHSSKFK